MKKNGVLFLCGLYTVIMVLCLVYFYEKGNVHSYQVAIGGIVCGLMPIVLNRLTKRFFNAPMILSYVLFLVGSQLLGSLAHFYSLGWWDTCIHFFSGILLAFVAVALYERLLGKEASSPLSVWLILLFVWGFAVFGGVLWEVYEFSMDHLFGMHLQGGGNDDTMTDLIADTIGGGVIALFIALRGK
ncbi:hypothetical protein A374_07594 [Fictibacillus macauensis ZFHKF-1]|uniref:Membrane-spanning protein n=1 Tax=Fictibacillus macauensis ZFHKF-1 TaxID=1196324 RepID=I8AIU9_9BACL|nr:hypothetical protein [Fictibacillus macauensis]EIT85682.1 hypothetical protein A374_07594 [Fictibacillus macauensis ZFHKF-1]